MKNGRGIGELFEVGYSFFVMLDRLFLKFLFWFMIFLNINLYFYY